MATPPFDYAGDHFGYRNRPSELVIEGSAGCRRRDRRARLRPATLLGYPDETDRRAICRKPKSSLKRKLFAYRGLQEHVGTFRDFLRNTAIRMKSGSWWPRSSWALAQRRTAGPRPDKDDPVFGNDRQRTNDFNYGRWIRMAMPCRWVPTSGE